MKNKFTTIKTRSGAASLFITVFTILLLSIIALSFTRLIMSEVARTSNNDLSQSAYDSALAGIEDAKIALLKYHDCLNKGFKSDPHAQPDTCGRIIYAMSQGIAAQSCDTVANTLNRTIEDHGVIVQETKNSTTTGNSANMLQAYTCVTIQEELNDYRSTLDTQNRIRIIPLRTAGTGGGVNDIASIKLSWFSDVNANHNGIHNTKYSNDLTLPSSAERLAPPVVSVQLLQADQIFSLGQLSTAAGDNNTNRGALYLKPVARGGSGDSLSSQIVSLSADKSDNQLFTVNCASGAFYCHSQIQLPNTFSGSHLRNEGASFLIVTLPYGQPDTDISIQLYNQYNKPLNFTGVQARVDSTGRANDLYRRVETRIELVDIHFPYPEFAIQMNDSETSVIGKDFWVTRDCWSAENGNKTDCEFNNFKDPSLSHF